MFKSIFTYHFICAITLIAQFSDVLEHVSDKFKLVVGKFYESNIYLLSKYISLKF